MESEIFQKDKNKINFKIKSEEFNKHKNSSNNIKMTEKVNIKLAAPESSKGSWKLRKGQLNQQNHDQETNKNQQQTNEQTKDIQQKETNNVFSGKKKSSKKTKVAQSDSQSNNSQMKNNLPQNSRLPGKNINNLITRPSNSNRNAFVFASANQCHNENDKLLLVQHKNQNQKHNQKLNQKQQQNIHHSFISDITDVRQMENTLLQLLNDFHSGKLQAFGQDITFEKMESVREQQEKLAKLHFDLNLQKETFGQQSEEGRRIAKDNMLKLIEKLQQLSDSMYPFH